MLTAVYVFVSLQWAHSMAPTMYTKLGGYLKKKKKHSTQNCSYERSVLEVACSIFPIGCGRLVLT